MCSLRTLRTRKGGSKTGDDGHRAEAKSEGSDAKEIKRAQERLVLFRAYYSMANVMYREYAPDVSFGRWLDAYFIYLCIAIGHFESRPFNVASLAAYMGIPRATVIRRVQYLVKLNIVQRRGRSLCLIPERVNRPSVLSALDRLTRTWREAVSTLDTLE